MVEIQLTPCNRDHVDEISEILENFNALAVTLTDLYDDPILEPLPGAIPLWPHVVVNALFDNKAEADCAHNYLSIKYPEINYTSQEVEDNDWVKTCVSDIKPQLFGENLWICPSWTTPPDKNAVVVTLDPGLAFGTGTHPTTSLCLHWLAKNNIQNKSVIDYGSGSGILGIAALKLGANHVYAIDLDPQALIATKQNAELNQIHLNKISINTPEIEPPASDYLIANILLNPLIELKHAFHKYLKSDGSLIVSGLLATQTDILIQEYQTIFIEQQTIIDGDWALIEFKKYS